MTLFISIDPGNKKCGLLLADIKSGKVIEAAIVSVNKFSDLVSLWNKDYQISKIIIGDGTNCQYIVKQLKHFIGGSFLFISNTQIRVSIPPGGGKLAIFVVPMCSWGL